MLTEWRAVPGFEGLYEVSDQGRVRSIDRPDVSGMKTLRGVLLSDKRTDSSGRPSAMLYKDRERTQHLVCWLVAAAFIGPRPEGLIICHRNGDHTDNRPCNLRYDTPSANNFDSVAHGVHHNANKTHCPEGHEYTLATPFHGRISAESIPGGAAYVGGRNNAATTSIGGRGHAVLCRKVVGDFRH